MRVVINVYAFCISQFERKNEKIKFTSKKKSILIETKTITELNSWDHLTLMKMLLFIHKYYSKNLFKMNISKQFPNFLSKNMNLLKKLTSARAFPNFQYIN